MRALPPLPESPTISVYGTSFHHERFVAEAIESVLDQDWPADRLQVVFVDDGSTDGTRGILERYRDRVDLVLQENRGVRGAVNRGMAPLTGDLITSISGDDVWEPGRLRTLAAAFREHPRAGLVHSDVCVIDGDGRLVAPSFREGTGIAAVRGPLLSTLVQRNVVTGTGIMFRGCLKDLVHPIPPDAAWEDYWWAWRIGRVADVVAIPEVTCRYRMHGANLSLGASPERIRASLHHERHFRRTMLRSLAPGEVDAAAALAGLRALRSALEARPDGPAGGAATGGGRASGRLAPADIAAASDLTVDGADRARAADRFAAAREAAADGDVGAAVVHAVAGLAEAPDDRALDAWLHDLADGWGAHLPSEHELRRRVVLADADVLAADPSLLRAWVARTGAADEETLVIHGRGWSDGALLSTFGAALEGSDADVLATGDSPLDRRALVRRAHATLGAVPGAEGLPDDAAAWPIRAVAAAARS